MPFYVTGGTLSPDAACYIERSADQQLLQALHERRFCYLLTSRQMGKSSLMVRTARKLAAAGEAVAVVDLSAIGQNLTPEQWYDGVLSTIAEQLAAPGLESATESHWRQHSDRSPLRRLIGALEEVVLPAIAPAALTVFVDEIDTVRSLPFSTDEFFAAIRECYNRRAQEPELGRLTFCLLGVAAPSDLIRDARLTPFNIGSRIELADFTPAEAAPLAAGLGREPRTADRLLRRVLHWTGGHPYLTQKLCEAVAGDAGCRAARHVDALAAALFWSPRARERDDNLLFVRERLLASGETSLGVAAVLDLYLRLRAGARVADDEPDALVTALRLAGLARAEAGRLAVRNRIYRRAFDVPWVQAHLPEAERLRQRRAFRRGALSIGAVAAIVLAVMGATIYGLVRTRDALRRTGTALSEQEHDGRRLLAASLAERGTRELLDGSTTGLWRLLEAARTVADQPEYAQRTLNVWAGWHWAVAERLVQMVGHAAHAYGVAWSPDGNQIATASRDGTARVWDPFSGEPVTKPLECGGFVRSVAFSPNSQWLVTGADGAFLRVWDATTGQPVTAPLRLAPDGTECWSVCFSADGRWVTGACPASAVAQPLTWRVFDAATGALRWELPRPHGLTAVAACPTGRWLAAAANDGAVLLLDAASFQAHELEGRLEGGSEALSFSADGRFVAAGCGPSARVWSVTTRRPQGPAYDAVTEVRGVALSPDGSRLALSPVPGVSATIYDTATHLPLGEPLRHGGDVYSTAFSPDGKYVATASRDGSAAVWDAATGRRVGLGLTSCGEVLHLAFSPDSRYLLTSGADGNARVWRVEPREVIRRGTTLLDPWVIGWRGNDTVLVALSGEPAVETIDAVAVQRREMLRFEGWSRALALGGDGELVLLAREPAAGGRTELRLHTIASREPHGAPILVDGEVQHAVILPGGSAVVAAHSGARRVELFSTADGAARWSIAVPDGVRALSLDAPGERLAVADKGHRVAVYRTADGAPLLDPPAEHSDEADGASLAPTGDLLATTGRDARIRVWRMGRGAEPVSALAVRSDAYGVDFAPDGLRLAGAGSGPSSWLWDPVLAVPCGPPDELLGGCYHLVWSPDGRRLAGNSGRRLAIVEVPPAPTSTAGLDDATLLALGFELDATGERRAVTWERWQALRRRAAGAATVEQRAGE